MLLLSLVVTLITSPATAPINLYTSTVSGPQLLKAEPEVLAFQAKDRTQVAAAIGQCGGTLEYLFARYYIVRGAGRREHCQKLLQSSGTLEKTLAAYRDPEGQLLLADGTILAQLDPSLSLEAVRTWATKLGAREVKVLRAAEGLYEITVARAQDTVWVAQQLHESGRARWAHADFLYQKQKSFQPNDARYSQQWHHDLIGSAAAWDIEKGSPDVIIAVLDSGLDTRHPDLKTKVVFPRDTLERDDDPMPDPRDAHGTAAAGLAAAIANNEIGVAGVCGGCSILPVRIMGESGWSRYGADSSAFYWATDHGAFVISNSWGPTTASAIPNNLDQAIRYAADKGRNGKGALILFATGNDGRENGLQELSSHPLVLGIGATDTRDRRESYSNHGKGIDLMAPAASVTTDMVGNDGYQRGDYMDMFNGTSAAAPVAAGVAGLVFSVNPEFTRGQLQSILIETADKVGTIAYTDGFNTRYGFGRVNVFRAVQMASGGRVCQPVTEDCQTQADDDCDGLKDADDPSCASDTTQVGRTCNQDFQCGTRGTCLREGYPEGYCSARCNSTAQCGQDAFCPGSGRGSYCLDACRSRSDCRAGYDCLAVGAAGERGCVPSCKINGCATGETCNEANGQCEHNGPVPVGGACADNAQCASNGICLSEDSFGVPDGYCGVRCRESTDCPRASTCQAVGSGWSMCMADCQKNSDCRPGYACWPDEKGVGACWQRCISSDDCNGAACNSYGLCGDARPPQLESTPPVTTQPPVSVPDVKPAPEAANACACDIDTACSQGCACDPECGKSMAFAGGGCAATQGVGSGWVLLLAAAMVGRRRVAK